MDLFHDLNLRMRLREPPLVLMGLLIRIAASDECGREARLNFKHILVGIRGPLQKH